jgi:hypothetical protein
MTQVPSQKFDPNYVAALREVLEIAVEQIAEQQRTSATKAKMAETIVRHAADGVTDAGELVREAVRAGADGAP